MLATLISSRDEATRKTVEENRVHRIVFIIIIISAGSLINDGLLKVETVGPPSSVHSTRWPAFFIALCFFFYLKAPPRLSEAKRKNFPLFALAILSVDIDVARPNVKNV